VIKIILSNEKRHELVEYRGQVSNKNAENALMILLNSEGKSSVKISEILKRHPHTVRMWLKRYIKYGIKGLDRLYSPGRPSILREKTKESIVEILGKSPVDFGYKANLWTVSLMVAYMKTHKGFEVSDDTIERSLTDMEYKYKRFALGVSENAPSKEEKVKRVKEIVNDIVQLTKKSDYEIFALDESHFSTEPYVVRGWQKKLWPPKNSMSGKKRATHNVWLLESKKKKILLEEIKMW
jgi:transposase